jgi:hypothetical protein
MTANNKVIKSVSFNITNETDAKILKAIKRRNFSGYVKKLLLAEILLKESTVDAQTTEVAEIKQTPVTDWQN